MGVGGAARSPRDPRRFAAAALAAILLYSVVHRLLSQPGGPKPEFPSRLPAPEVGGRAPLPEEGGRLLRPGPGDAGIVPYSGGLSAPALVEVLRRTVDSPERAPAARRFVRTFQSHRELPRVVDEFRRRAAKGQTAKASDLLGRLSAMPAFSKALDQYLSTPGSAAVARDLLAQPRVRALLYAGGPAPPAPAKRDRRISRGDLERLRRLFPAVSAFQGLAAESFQTAPSGSGADRKTQDPQSPGSPASLGAPAPPGAREAGPSFAGGGFGSQGPDAGEVDPKLPPIVDPISPEVERPCRRFAFLCGPGAPFSEGELRRLIDLIDGMGIGLWGACFELGRFGDCLRACRAANPAGSATCALPGGTAWGACLDAFGSRERCAQLCGQQPPCHVPSTEPCSAHPVLCRLYARHLLRLPDANGASYWNAQLSRLRAEGVPEDQLESRLDRPFQDGIQWASETFVQQPSAPR